MENSVVVSGPGSPRPIHFWYCRLPCYSSCLSDSSAFVLIFLLSVTSSMLGGCGYPPSKVGLFVSSAQESLLQREMAVPYHAHYLVSGIFSFIMLMEVDICSLSMISVFS